LYLSEPKYGDPEAAHLQKAGMDLPKTLAERTVKELSLPAKNGG
jgi:hypothetical protein